MKERLDWNEYFLNMAYLVAMRSPDPMTHNGAVIVGPNNEVISTGYNGFPMGVEHKAERMGRPEKYFWMSHSEVNALYLCPIRPVGCKMYVTGLPCADCARGIIQSGIVEVYIDANKDWIDNQEKWLESCRRTVEMFKEADVKVSEIGVKLVQIERYQNGKYL